MLGRFPVSKISTKLICIVLVLALIEMSCFYSMPAQAGIVSDIFGLDGLSGKVADDVFDGGCKLIGGVTYNLAKTIYDSGSGAISMLTGEHSVMGKIAGWMDVGLNVASAGLIIFAIATGSATFPVIATITLAVTALKAAVDNLKNIDKILSWLKKNLGDVGKGLLDVYKPNIYIYSDHNIDVNVQLHPYSYITASIPEYDREAGWNASVYKGTINGCNDYLFYEAKVPDNHLQRNKGFKITGCRLQSDLQTLMELYGFNDKETSDFVEYWKNKLSYTNNYIFYPQDTETIQKIMPLTVVPAPDSVCRIWFLIEKDDGQFVETVFPMAKVAHSGFAVVEWGGIMGSSE
ncbi:hypothetical protein [Phosphitispora sp. TUW77]|uniref:hypothetical protein n=1 Tax=Phosphitispora sp. TUW77 TaxID=3152361 RepID=UPI003AB72BC0